MNDTREEIIRTILGYENGSRTPLRTMEIIYLSLNESSEKDTLHNLICKAVESWDDGSVTAEDALERIGALLRSSPPHQGRNCGMVAQGPSPLS